MNYRLVAYNYVFPENTYFIKYKVTVTIYLVSSDIKETENKVLFMRKHDILYWDSKVPLEFITFILSKTINAEIFELSDEDIMYMKLMDWIS